MLEKRAYFPGVDPNGNPLVEAITFGKGLTKTASVTTTQLHPQISTYLGALKESEEKLYVLVNALGSWEYWGQNINGDIFKDAVLRNEDPRNGYKTFLNAGIYRHHVNKDPRKSMGEVVVAIWNPRMHRVELVLCIDRARARALGHQDLIDELDCGGNPAVSMGMKTPKTVIRKRMVTRMVIWIMKFPSLKNSLAWFVRIRKSAGNLHGRWAIP